jgi:microcystin degradation protein MlrC
MRVLIAGLSHETHTFLRSTTPREAFFTIPFDAHGPSQITGALQVAREAGWEVVPGPYWLATPSGTVDDGVLETWWAELEPLLAGQDAVYLDLHGAMASVSFPDVEGEVLQRLRAATRVPIGVALDLHGNITDRMAIDNAVFSAYRHNPHTDVQETARRVATLLHRVLTTGERPRAVRLQPPLLWPPTGTGTASDPMQTLERLARESEAADPALLDLSVFGGFSFSDLPEAGVSFLATALSDPTDALRKLAAAAWELREQGVPPRTPLSSVSVPDQEGPLLLIEPAENVGGGAPGDGTHVLRYLIENRVEGGAVKLYDPPAVEAFWDLPDQSVREIGIGAHSGEAGIGTPVVVPWEKVRQSDGAYSLSDPHSHNAMWGAVQQMGRSVVLRAHGVTVLVTSLRVAPMDLGPWLSVGLDPASFRAIGVKAAVAHRQAYDPIAAHSLWLDVPGPCDENLARLPYTNLRRPVWPIDPIENL